MITLKKLDLDAYRQLREGGTVLESDLYGEKVIRLDDGAFLKVFRRKRLISSALFYPYAQRFADNCQAVAAKGIPCPEVIGVFRVAGLQRDVVHYRPLPGLTIRQLLAAGLGEVESNDLRRRLGVFIAGLHRQGIYFRSLHLGNIVLTPQGEIGLIDLADLSVRRGALGAQGRSRNMRHLQRYRDEMAWLRQDGLFDEAYAGALKSP